MKRTHSENLDFALNLAHANTRIDTPSTDQLYSNFFAPLVMQAELDFAKLALAESLEQQIGSKLWNCAIWMCSSIRKCSRVLLDIKRGGGRERFLVGVMRRGSDLMRGAMASGAGLVRVGRGMYGSRLGAV
jgi:hypothetical protein